MGYPFPMVAHQKCPHYLRELVFHELVEAETVLQNPSSVVLPLVGRFAVPWNHRMSMCFAFFDVPCRVAMLLRAVESVCMRMFTFAKPDSCRNIFKCSPSLVPVQIA